MIIFSQIVEGQKITVEVPDDLTISALVEAFRAFCLAVGYHPDNVREATGETPA